MLGVFCPSPAETSLPTTLPPRLATTYVSRASSSASPTAKRACGLSSRMLRRFPPVGSPNPVSTTRLSSINDLTIRVIDVAVRPDISASSILLTVPLERIMSRIALRVFSEEGPNRLTELIPSHQGGETVRGRGRGIPDRLQLRQKAARR